MRESKQPLRYSLAAGIILFAFGLFGFAFHGFFDVADKYLLMSLALGFWGLVVASDGLVKKQK